MGYPLAMLLAVIQGLTEFLPVSSSGHLRLCGALFGLERPTTAYDVVLHAGTLLAVIIVFRAELRRMLGAVARTASLWRSGGARALWDDADARLVLLLGLAMVPTGILGLAIKRFENQLAQVWLVGLMLIINGAVLMLSRPFSTRATRGLEDLGARDALAIGLAQGVGVLRGISRSGSTIIAGMGIGLRPAAAFSFSFLLAIPAILAALVVESRDIATGTGMTAGEAVVGFAIALVVGWGALLGLRRLVDRGKLHYFAVYCWIVGGLAIVSEVLRR